MATNYQQMPTDPWGRPQQPSNVAPQVVYYQQPVGQPQMMYQPQPMYMPPGSQQVMAVPIQQQPMYFAHQPRSSNRGWLICCGITFAVVLFISLMVYFLAIRCRHGEVVVGRCPSNAGLDRSRWLQAPKSFDAGTSCDSNDDSNTGSCCDWRGSTCCNDYGCRMKTAYSLTLGYDVKTDLANCSQLLGLLSCSVCAPSSGDYVDGSANTIYMCPSFCQELYDTCSSVTRNATAWCNNLPRIVVRSNGCYSAASSAKPLTLLVAALGFALMTLQRSS